MKNKGKRKKYLYILRNNRKIFRSHYRKATGLGVKTRHSEIEYDNFLGRDYTKVIDCFRQSKFEKSRLMHERSNMAYIKIPKVFSVSADAEAAIEVLREIFSKAYNTSIKHLFFDHSDCIDLGLSASTITDIIILAVDQYRNSIGKPLECEGIFSTKKEVRDILLASGLPYHLKARSNLEYDENRVKRFETVKGTNGNDRNKADETATKLTEYFNKCLRTQSYELNMKGKSILSHIFGEVLSNCEIHGGSNATWYTQGHYQIRSEDEVGEMQLLFLNIGKTIYEGLQAESTQDTQALLTKMRVKHEQNMSPVWDEEMIFTVFALQEGVSRLRDREKIGYEGRGSGTVSMIEKFNTIGESDAGLKPQMTILSGSTLIKFSDKYKMEQVEFVNDDIFGTCSKKIIAFNKDNDIFQPADADDVQKLKQHFPGTIISLKFYLDNRYITRLKMKG